MILHIANDEKFIDMGFRIFEEVAPHFDAVVGLDLPKGTDPGDVPEDYLYTKLDREILP